jgi:hypothetical protein
LWWSPDSGERYLGIDGYKRVAALEQLGRDTVEATVWARSLRFSPPESALEQGWLLAEMEQRFGCSVEELELFFDRSPSWVSRRLTLVELLPEAVQCQVRAGKLAAPVAMKYLAPVARVDANHCVRMAAAFVEHRCDTRQAGQVCRAWRNGSRVVRERVLAEPELFLKTQQLPPAAKPASAAQVARDLEMAVAILHRARRRLPEVMTTMNGPQQEQLQRHIESARRELNRLAQGMGKEQESKHAEPGSGIPEDFPIHQSKHSIFGASKVAGDIMVQEYGRHSTFRRAACAAAA